MCYRADRKRRLTCGTTVMARERYITSDCCKQDPIYHISSYVTSVQFIIGVAFVKRIQILEWQVSPWYCCQMRYIILLQKKLLQQIRCCTWNDCIVSDAWTLSLIFHWEWPTSLPLYGIPRSISMHCDAGRPTWWRHITGRSHLK
jgi:hypothetical protein